MKTVLMLALAAALASGVQAAEPGGSQPFPLTTLDGTVYKNCRILKVTPESMTVMHEAGVSRIPFENLAEEWRVQFKYDPAKAKAYAREEERKVREAKAKRIAASRKRNKDEERRMEALVALEKKDLAAGKIAADLGPPLAPAPLPGDPTPELGATAPVEEVIPSLSPITQIYTPGAGTYRMYGRDRYGSWSSGYSYSYPYLPIYTPPRYPIYCPPGLPHPVPH